MKALLSLIRSRNDKPLEFCQMAPDRLPEVLQLFTAGQDLSKSTSAAEQNRLLFLLLGSSWNVLSEALHRMAISIISEDSDVAKFEKMLCWILFIPFEVHIMLSELGLTFGAVSGSEKTRNQVAALVTEILFSGQIDRQAEARVARFVLLFAPWLFGHPAKRGRQLRCCAGKLVVFEGNVAMTCDGPVNLKLDATEAFAAPRDLEAALATAAGGGAAGECAPPREELAEFAARVAGARDAAIDCADRAAEDFEAVEFESLFER